MGVDAMRSATSYQLATGTDNTGSYASIRSLGAGLVTAFLVQQAMFGLSNTKVQDAKYGWFKQAGIEHSTFQTSQVVIDRDTEKLLAALESVYHKLAGDQIDLAAEDKKILYDNLWELYS